MRDQKEITITKSELEGLISSHISEIKNNEAVKKLLASVSEEGKRNVELSEFFYTCMDQGYMDPELIQNLIKKIFSNPIQQAGFYFCIQNKINNCSKEISQYELPQVNFDSIYELLQTGFDVEEEPPQTDFTFETALSEIGDWFFFIRNSNSRASDLPDSDFKVILNNLKLLNKYKEKHAKDIKLIDLLKLTNNHNIIFTVEMLEPIHLALSSPYFYDSSEFYKIIIIQLEKIIAKKTKIDQLDLYNTLVSIEKWESLLNNKLMEGVSGETLFYIKVMFKDLFESLSRNKKWEFNQKNEIITWCTAKLTLKQLIEGLEEICGEKLDKGVFQVLKTRILLTDLFPDVIATIPLQYLSKNTSEIETKKERTGNPEIAYTAGLEAYRSRKYKRAFRYFKLAAQQGHKDACLHLGLSYINGSRPEKDYQMANQWLRLVKEKAYSVSLTLGKWCSNNGKYYDAFEWFRLAVEQHNDDKDAQYHLGQCYLRGRGTAKNLPKAIQLLTLVKEKTNPEEKYFIGCYLLAEKRTNQDKRVAFTWLKSAADQNHPMAQYIVANYYLSEKVEVSKAIQLLTSSADQNNPRAQFRLSECYMDGEGVNKNLGEAKRLFGLATRNSKDDEELRNNASTLQQKLSKSNEEAKLLENNHSAEGQSQPLPSATASNAMFNQVVDYLKAAKQLGGGNNENHSQTELFQAPKPPENFISNEENHSVEDQAMQALKTDLLTYFSSRCYQEKYSHWYSIGLFSHSGSDKLNLVTKILSFIDKKTTHIVLNPKELAMLLDENLLRISNLGKIYLKHQKTFDALFANDPIYKTYRENRDKSMEVLESLYCKLP